MKNISNGKQASKPKGGCRRKGSYVRSRRVIQRNYDPGGSDYLIIQNSSSVALEYAIVGNPALRFHKDISGFNLSNRAEIAADYVIKEAPAHIVGLVVFSFFLSVREGRCRRGSFFVFSGYSEYPIKGGITPVRGTTSVRTIFSFRTYAALYFLF